MKNRILYIICAVALMMTTSCNKWLQVSPSAKVPTRDMFKTEDGFKDAAISCYIKLKSTNLYGKSLTITDIEFLAQHWDLDTYYDKDEISLKGFDYKTEYSENFLSETYLNLYNVISQANLVLENLATKGNVIKEDALRNTIEAEMLAMRAFCHLDILRLYGQMPNNPKKTVKLAYVETNTRDANTYHDYATFIAKVEADLLKAEQIMKDTDPILKYSYKELNELKVDNVSFEIDSYYSYRRFRMNYYAVKALQARFYLYTSNKDKAYDAAKVVIEAKDRDGNPFVSLAGDVDINETYYALPSECLFAVHNIELHNKEYRDMFEIKLDIGLKLAKKKMNDIFANTAGTNNRRKIWEIGRDYQNFERPYIRKYIPLALGQSLDASLLTVNKELMPILRLSEVYLIAMECSQSLSELNTLYIDYMKARGELVKGFDSMSERAPKILEEYRREFFAEGQMFYTYKRLGIETMLWKTDRTVTEDDYVAPVPASELNK